jgi:hypothetical protein
MKVKLAIICVSGLQFVLSLFFAVYGCYCVIGQNTGIEHCHQQTLPPLFYTSRVINYALYVLNSLSCCVILWFSRKKGIPFSTPWRHLYHVLRDRQRSLYELRLWFFTVLIIVGIWYHFDLFSYLPGLASMITLSIGITSLTTSYLAGKNISPAEVRHRITVKAVERGHLVAEEDNDNDNAIEGEMTVLASHAKLLANEDLDYLVQLCFACCVHNAAIFIYDVVVVVYFVYEQSKYVPLLLAVCRTVYRYMQMEFYYQKQAMPSRNPLLPYSPKCHPNDL